MIIDLPEGVEMFLVLYITSDKAQTDIAYKVGGFNKMADRFLETVDISKLDLPPIADDWRVMTRTEIVDYKTREAIDEAE